VSIHALFPTLVYTASLQRGDSRDFNRQLLKECRQLRLDDAAGRRWSEENYPGGYTSYGSVHRLQTISPTFESLRQKLKRHIAAFAAALEWDLRGRELEMTDCWVNIMPRAARHGAYTAPASSLELKRHLLRASAKRISRHQIRRSALGSIHGGAAALGPRTARVATLGNLSSCRGEPAVVRKLAAS
jgi:hypothetical protein